MRIGRDSFDDVSKGSLSQETFSEHIIGTINIPKLNLEIPLFDTTNAELLENGATVLNGTSQPVGGASTHSVITGHRGLPRRELFTNLPDLKEGDIFLIRVLKKTLTYEVEDIQIVEPDETSSLKIQDGKDLITLITCTPYMVNSHRLLVTGHRIPNCPYHKENQSIIDWFSYIRLKPDCRFVFN